MEKNKVNVYSTEQRANIITEFLRVKGNCYLDHSAATLYSEKQLENVFSDLSRNMYANPHARNTSSQQTEDAIDIVRYQILSQFNTTQEEYSVIFTSGATQSLKTIAETFDFNGGTLAYLEDNHTSVLGMRHFAPNFREVKLSEAHHLLSSDRDFKFSPSQTADDEANCLFVYPAQSNFAGAKYPLSWIERVNQGGLDSFEQGRRKWYTVLDAASFVATNELDLTKYKPDFVPISFYKIFGYPTGLGALLVRRSSEELLKKKYFGGGTVLTALSSENVMIPRSTLHERFEDGTLPFLSILAVKHGFDTFKRLNLTADLISQHAFYLAKYTFENMSMLNHSNGEPIAVFYHDTKFVSRESQGGVVNFNLKRCDGEYVGYTEVLHIANLHGIHLRTGCFCNPGACQKSLKLTANDVRRHFEAGHVCGDQHDLIDGYPTGSVRISFGYMSSYEDADRFLNMIETCFVTKQKDEKQNRNKNIIEKNIAKVKNGFDCRAKERKITGTIRKIFLYPVKSCGAYSVGNSWELTNTGLKYDRKWMVVNAAGSCVSQKHIKKMCMIKPAFDFKKNVLTLTLTGTKEIAVPLNPPGDNERDAHFCDSKVCGDKIQGYDCGDNVAEWLSENLGRPGLRLLRQCDFTEHITARSSRNAGPQSPLSLANKAQYLLVNLASIRWLKQCIPQEDASNQTLDSIILRFRANFVVDFQEVFVENELDCLQFENDVVLKCSGNCTRCQMICIDQETGDISKEPLQTLAKEMKGKISFGIYLSQHGLNEATTVVKKGCAVVASIKNKE